MSDLKKSSLFLNKLGLKTKGDFVIFKLLSTSKSMPYILSPINSIITSFVDMFHLVGLNLKLPVILLCDIISCSDTSKESFKHYMILDIIYETIVLCHFFHVRQFIKVLYP